MHCKYWEELINVATMLYFILCPLLIFIACFIGSLISDCSVALLNGLLFVT